MLSGALSLIGPLHSKKGDIGKVCWKKPEGENTVEIYHIMKGVDKVTRELLSMKSQTTRMRRHPLKLEK